MMFQGVTFQGVRRATAIFLRMAVACWLVISFSPQALALTVQPEVAETLQRLAADEKVQKALAYVEADHPRRVDETRALAQVAAPPFHEQQRAEFFARLLAQAGLEDVHIDEEGNVLGTYRGVARRPKLILSAHLDTVFPPGYDPTPRIDEEGVIHGPGIGDDTAGLTALLSLARAFIANDIRPVGDILFVGTVGEEGRGDLRGVKYLFASHSDIDGFISIDGGGSGPAPVERFGISYMALGSKRYEIHFRGPGGHSW